MNPTEDARFIVYEDVREMIVTSVSVYSLQRQSNRDIRGPNVALKSPKLHYNMIHKRKNTNADFPGCLTCLIFFNSTAAAATAIHC